MSMQLFTLRKQREDVLAKADSILKAAESTKRQLTASEDFTLTSATHEVSVLNAQIKQIEKSNTILKQFPSGQVLTDLRPGSFDPSVFRAPTKVLTSEYCSDFFRYIGSAGKEIGAALYEGAAGSGGYAVPIVVDDQIVPLAPQEMGVRRLASVIPTTSDIKFPTKTAFGTAAAKAESAAFGGTQPTIGQFTLSAFMAGTEQQISWELVQDVPAFQAFVVDDMILDQQMYEENLYLNGSGTGQAQGLLGNVGTGGTYEPDANGNLVTIQGTLALTGTLNAVYHRGASWLMTRETSIILRTSQVQANLFLPAWTRIGSQDFLHSYPVEYSAYMPTAARSAAPVLFGDFKRGYIIGDRGGSGINVKVLDQPLATQGLLVLLAYRRTDGRVRRSEAIQQYNVAAS
jgi:HK97 family phage major capsid protein